jgi:hypothetical protein
MRPPHGGRTAAGSSGERGTDWQLREPDAHRLRRGATKSASAARRVTTPKSSRPEWASAIAPPRAARQTGRRRPGQLGGVVDHGVLARWRRPHLQIRTAPHALT